MWTQLAVGFVGLCGGTIVATALAAFVIGLGIIPRYAGITHTGNHLLLYESSLVAGTIFGNLVQLYHIRIPLGMPGLVLVGLGFGIFLGSWILSLIHI